MLDDKYNLSEMNGFLENKSPKEIIDYAINLLGVERVTTASSLSIEDQMLTQLAINSNKNSRIFVLDTGRHFQSTYDVMDETQRKYKFKYDIYFQDTREI